MRAEATARPAFTLLEVVVALTIGASAITLAAALTRVAADAAAHTASAVVVADTESNGERLLRRLIGQMDLPAPNDSLTRGGAGAMAFDTWCDTPHGWLVRCRATLTVGAPAEGILVQLSTDERIKVLPGRGVRGFLYLRSATHGGRWSESWIGTMAVPPAIGVVLERDTLIIRIEERG